jgi:hypothetical protein
MMSSSPGIPGRPRWRWPDPATGHERPGWAAVAVSDQLGSRGSALLWSWPFRALAGVSTGGRSTGGNRCSVGGDRLACPKVAPTAALAARRRAVTCRQRCWPGAALGWCTPRPPRSRWSGRARQRCARRRSGRWCSARGCQRPGGEQPPRPSPRCSAEGCSCRRFGISRLASPVWLRCRGSAAGSASPAAQRRRGDQLGDDPEQLQPATEAQRLGFVGRRGPGQRLGALDLDADQHGGRFQGTPPPCPRLRGSGSSPPGMACNPGARSFRPGRRTPPGQRCQAIGARGSGV